MHDLVTEALLCEVCFSLYISRYGMIQGFTFNVDESGVIGVCDNEEQF